MGGGASRPLGAMWWWWFLLSRASDAPRVKNFSSRGAGWVLDEKARRGRETGAHLFV